ncbi:MAG: pentapeptide repeat-containing protein [Planctomycetota bacterium]|jgi:uncharacterized protein YjbI with pentapeptide repeats
MNQGEALKLLTGGSEGIIEWNRRVEAGDKIPSLHGVNLGKSDLGDTQLEGASLGGANLAGADLSDAALVGADLSNADLHDADLSDASIFTANLTNANIEDADLSGADLGHANLAGANMNGADLEDADLSNANLRGAGLGYADLEDANLNNANLAGVDLSNATLVDAELTNAELSGADLSGADLSNACLAGANLRGANLTKVTLTDADLSDADLEDANLEGAVLSGTNLERASLAGCRLHGMFAWDAKLEGATQASLAISGQKEPTICVDGLVVAQLLDLLSHNKEVRDVLRASQSRLVLILGRFAAERAPILDAIRQGLRCHNLRPVSFDAEKPLPPDSISTISTLACLARFVVADLTTSGTVLDEIEHIVRNVAVPVMPLLLDGSGNEPAGLTELRASKLYLLGTYGYTDAQHLLESFEEQIIVPVSAMVDELRREHGGGKGDGGSNAET